MGMGPKRGALANTSHFEIISSGEVGPVGAKDNDPMRVTYRAAVATDVVNLRSNPDPRSPPRTENKKQRRCHVCRGRRDARAASVPVGRSRFGTCSVRLVSRALVHWRSLLQRSEQRLRAIRYGHRILEHDV